MLYYGIGKCDLKLRADQSLVFSIKAKAIFKHMPGDGQARGILWQKAEIIRERRVEFMNMKREDVRNIAIIAHVDHGKTTLVDELLKQSGVFRANQEVAERVMDSNDIERERGITILAKNTAVFYKDTKINIIDTPGHADFGGEVERVLKMVNGVILMVDAYEGAMPQTKFVLRKALELDLSVIVCINKIDRPEARPREVEDEILELLMDLDASDEQLECPFLYASAREGYAKRDPEDASTDMGPLFETIIEHIPAPEGDPEAGTQVLVSTIDYNEYVGRIGVGKVDNGKIRVNQECALVNHHDPGKLRKVKIGKLYEFDGLNKVEVQEAGIGSIVAISGITDLHIGDTLCATENPEAIPFQKISEPTIAMNFMVNDSPLAGQEGKYVTSRHLRERLFRELNTDVSLRVEETESPDCFKVSGRGELHLSVLIENMRREGYEFAVSKAEVLYKFNERNQKQEPMELAYIDVPEEFTGAVIQKLTSRKGELQGMSPANGGYTRLEFEIPARGLIGYRGEFMTDTKGNGIMNTIFDGYAPYKGDLSYRKTGSLIAYESGESITYGLFAAQERGALFIGPGVKVYGGMVIGQNPKTEDIEINVCKTKKLTNTRSSSADEALKLTPPRDMSLEQCLDFIDTDELLEVTPASLRIRKRILDSTLRKRASFKKN
jgi:GTP-binding protein